MTFGVAELKYPYCHFGEATVSGGVMEHARDLLAAARLGWGKAEVDQRTEYAAGRHTSHVVRAERDVWLCAFLCPTK
jgi:hypothetical protein